MSRRDLRRTFAVAVAATAALLLAGCGGGAQSTQHLAGTPPGPITGPGPGPAPARGSHTSGASRTGPSTTTNPARSRAGGRPPALRHLQATIVRTERKAGRQTGFLVYDLTTGKTLFNQRAGIPRPPASVAKIYSSVALLSLLGPQARLHTDVLGTGHLKPDGVWHGNLYLRGDGDPTFGEAGFDRVWEDGYGSLVGSVVAQLRARGIRRVTGLVYGDGSRFDAETGGPFTHGQPDVPDYGGEMSALTFDHGGTSRKLTPPEFAARELALTMRAQHMHVRAATRPARTPRRARILATVASPPLSVLLKLMDVPSDDLFADLLTKQLGYRFRGHGTLGAGAVEIRRVLGGFGLRPVLHDGSGLDPADRSTPAEVVSLLRQIWNRPLGRMLDAALPVVGVDGTVQGIAVHTPAQGNCVAKTGTLNTVTNLAGVCTARGGNQVAFALFIDGPYNWQALPILGRMVAAIAGY